MELRDYLSLLGRRKWIIVLAAGLVAGAALVASFLQTPIYEAKARLFLEANASVFDTNASQQLSTARIQTEIQVLQSAPVRNAVREKLGVAPPVSVTQVGQTEVLEVSVQAAKPKLAAELTDAYVVSYVDYRRKQAVDELVAKGKEIQRVVDDLKAQVADVDAKLAAIPRTATTPAGPISSPERDALVSQLSLFKQKLDQLGVDSALKNGNAQIVAPAEVPTIPVSPRPLRNGVLGLGLGLVLGVAAALLVEHLDDSIKTKEDLERSARGLHVLGLIPEITSWKNRGDTRVISRTEPTSPAAEAYRSLRTSINFLGVDRAMRVIQITSSNPSEGKSTTIANLAVALARAGERVVVVNCDLRRPRIHEFFDLPDSVGFTNVFLGELPVADALQAVAGERNLRLLASGKLPLNPSELLSSPRTGQILQELKSMGVMVLIDCPPVLPVTDAAVLSSRVDGTLLVASAGSTTGKDLTRALEVLRQVDAPLVGTVLNGVSAESGYGYQYGYYKEPPEKGSANGKKQANARRQANGRQAKPTEKRTASAG
ncbi:MAG: tyrosine-protein kinase [Actinomycetota bacterium]|nr:tyrosine-protein kinase [Actinomycetota bacterium]